MASAVRIVAMITAAFTAALPVPARTRSDPPTLTTPSARPTSADLASTPRNQTPSGLKPSIPPAIVYQWTPFVCARVDHFRHEDRVIACRDHLCDSALKPGERFFEKRAAKNSETISNCVESPLSELVSEAAR